MLRMCSDKEIREMDAKGYSTPKIARQLNISLLRVRKLLCKSNKCTDQQIMDMYNRGYSKKQICRILHTGYARIIKLVGHKPKKDYLQKEIVDMFCAGFSGTHIQRKLKVSTERIKKVLVDLKEKSTELELAAIVTAHISAGRKPAFIARSLKIDKSEISRLVHLIQGYDNIEYFDQNCKAYQRCGSCGADVIMPCLACQIRKE